MPPPGPGRLHRLRQVGAGPGAGPPARRRRAGDGRLHAGLPGHGHRHRQADRLPSAPRSPTTCSTWPTRPRSGASPAGRPRPARPSPAIEARGHRALLVGGTGLYFQALVDGLDPPGQYPRSRAELEQEPDTAALHRRLAALDPLAASRMEPSNRRRVVRALEVTLGSGRPFSSHGPGMASFPATSWRLAGRLAAPAGRRRPASRPGSAAMVAAGLVDEVSRLRRPARGHVAHRPPGAGLPGGAGPPGGGRAPDGRRSPRPSGAPGRSPAASGCGGGGTPASGGTGPSITRSPSCRSCWETGGSHDVQFRPPAISPSRSCTGSATTSWSCSTPGDLRPWRSTRRPAPVLTPHLGSALCDRHHGRRRRTAHPAGAPAAPGAARTRRRRLRFQLWNADGSEAEMSGNGIRCLAHAALDAGWVADGRALRGDDAGRPAGGDDPPGHLRGADLGDGGHGRGRRSAARPTAATSATGSCSSTSATRTWWSSGLTPPPSTSATLGPALEATDPAGLNVEFVALGPGPDEVTMRVWERGVGETRPAGPAPAPRPPPCTIGAGWAGP